MRLIPRNHIWCAPYSDRTKSLRRSVCSQMRCDFMHCCFQRSRELEITHEAWTSCFLIEQNMSKYLWKAATSFHTTIPGLFTRSSHQYYRHQNNFRRMDDKVLHRHCFPSVQLPVVPIWSAYSQVQARMFLTQLKMRRRGLSTQSRVSATKAQLSFHGWRVIILWSPFNCLVLC